MLTPDQATFAGIMFFLMLGYVLLLFVGWMTGGD